MSNVIRDVEKLTQKQIETAKRRGERELKNLQSIHENMKSELKKTHDAEVVDIRNTHQNHLDTEAQRKERILQEMKSHLEETKKLTEKELKTLKDNSVKEKTALAEKNSTDRERINGEHELYLEDQNFRFNQSAKKIHDDGQGRVEQMQTEMNEKYLDTEKQGQEKIQKQTNEFTTRFTHDQLNYQKMKDNQDKQFKTERFSTNIRQQGELKKMTDQHTGFIEQRDENFRKGLEEQDRFFEKKYAGQLETHNKHFKELEEKNKKVVADLKTSLTKEITKTAEKQNDPFFKFEALNPTLRQFEDRVEVSVEVPEYSKTDIQLAIHQKEAILSFNRRYSDANKLADGTINKVNKVESFTTRLPTSHVLDAKSVKSSYENGVMTYVIKRA